MLKLFVSLLIIIFGSCSQSHNQKPEFTGIIPSDSSLDTLNFKPCNEKMLPYYPFTSKTLYEGEKPKIVSHFNDQFKKVSNETGYVTIRFIVNCYGETGRFRVIKLDENYQVKQFSKLLTDQLLKLTMTLDGLKYGENEGHKFDYYNYLTFKMKNGEIKSYRR